MSRKIDIGEAPLCACGCGQRVKRNPCGYAKWNRYITGHNRRGHKNGENQKKAASLAHKGIPLNIPEEVEKERRRKISEFQKGRSKSKDYAEKMSKILKDKYKNDEEYIKKMSDAREKTRIKKRENPATEETRFKMSTAATKRINEERKTDKFSKRLMDLFGDRFSSINFAGTVNSKGYSIEFNSTLRREIKRRDNYTCRECNKTSSYCKLQVHHIDYDKTNSNKDNLITLCVSCHAKTAKRNIPFWIMYYKYKMMKESNYLINKFDQIGCI